MENKNSNQTTTSQNLSTPVTTVVDSTKITIILPTQAYFLSGIRDFTLNLIKNLTKFSEQWAYRFQSIVDELCNNAIEYGSMPGNDIKIIFISNTESIEIVVEDSGLKPNHLKAAEIQKLVTERRSPNYIHKGIRGRGLSKIVSEWSDELQFSDLEDGGTRVRVKKLLNDPKLKTNPAFENQNLIIINN